MIILDTNVISVAMRASPSPVVMDWVDAQSPHELATTTITIAEIGFGLARMPIGRRRAERERLFANLIMRAFGDRVFSFDRPAAEAYGELLAARERGGRPLRGPDGFIAAIAASRGMAVATRDIRGFGGCGLRLIDPWNAAPV